MTRQTIKTLLIAQALTLMANCATVSPKDPEVLPLCREPLTKKVAVQKAIGEPQKGLSFKEAQAFAIEAGIDLEADQLLIEPSNRQLLLSAALCEAEQRLRDIGDPVMDNLSPAHYAAYKSAQRDITNANIKLGVLDLETLSCTSLYVDQLAQCLSNIPPSWCDKNPHIQAKVRAAEKLNQP